MAKYIDISNCLREKITNGQYKNKEKIPDEKTLCSIYNASKMTIKKAVDILVSEGYLTKKQGSGTYINSFGSVNPLADPIRVSEPSSLSMSYKGRNVTSKILIFTVIPADEKIAESLLLNEGDFVYKLYRVRYVDNEALCIEEVYMPINIIIGLKMYHIEHSIYDYIVHDLKLKPKSFHKYIYSRPSNKTEMEELGLKSSEPVSVVEQIAFLNNGIPYEYSIVSHRYDKYKFKTIIVI